MTVALEALTGRDLLGAARLRAEEQEIYFTNALWSLRVIEMPGYGTLGVDEGFRLIVDPLVCVKWGVKKLTWVVRHEIRHPLFQHMERERVFTPTIENELKRHWAALVAWMKSRKYSLSPRPTPHAIHQLMNVFQDCEINDSMIHGPDDDKEATEYEALLARRFGFPADEMFETYVRMALEAAKKSNPQPEEEQGGEGGEGAEGGDRSGQPRSSDQGSGGAGDGQQAGGKGKAGEDAGDGERQGGGAGDGAADGQPDVPADSGSGSGSGEGTRGPGCGGHCGISEEVQKALAEAGHEPLTPGESEVIRNVVAAAIQQSNEKGSIPANLRKWADQQLKPARVPWENQLRAVVRNVITEVAGAMDYSYKKLGRRTAGYALATGKPIILPSLRQPIPTVGIVVDSSGSMGDGSEEGSRINVAYSETAGIVKAMKCPVKVWAVDCAVANVVKVSGKIDIAKLAEGGGGGTDMRVGIKAAADPKEKLDIIIVLTDAITDWPTPEEMPKKAKLIVAVVGDQAVPDHIRVIRIPNTQ